MYALLSNFIEYCGYSSEQTVEEKAAEVASYDKKVYRASKTMADTMSLELGRMGTPFFCIDKTIIRPESMEAEDGTPGITENELVALKRRLLEHLVDMYGES
jgi:hypothetical protein